MSESCPICGKATEHRYRPFCSKRCADVDLGRWFQGVYRIETEETPPDPPPADPPPTGRRDDADR